MIDTCEFCGYQWGEYIERHLKRGDCEANMRLRGHIASGVLMTPFHPITPEEAQVVESAGLEVWAHPDNSEMIAVPYWVWAVCQQVSLKIHRVWLLEALIRDPKMYLKISREPGSLGRVLLSMIVQRKK